MIVKLQTSFQALVYINVKIVNKTPLQDMRARIPSVNVAYYINVATLRDMEQATGTKILTSKEQLDQDEDEDGIVDETDRYNY